MKKNLLKFAMALAVCCVAFSACKKDDEETCEDCFTLTALGFGETTCESDLASPEAYQDSLTSAEQAVAFGFGLLTLEESVECE